MENNDSSINKLKNDVMNVFDEDEMEELKQVFDLFDSRGVGTLLLEDLKGAFETVGVKDLKGSLEKHIQTIRSNNEKNPTDVTFEEFLTIMSQYAEKKDDSDEPESDEEDIKEVNYQVQRKNINNTNVVNNVNNNNNNNNNKDYGFDDVKRFEQEYKELQRLQSKKSFFHFLVDFFFVKLYVIVFSLCCPSYLLFFFPEFFKIMDVHDDPESYRHSFNTYQQAGHRKRKILLWTKTQRMMYTMFVIISTVLCFFCYFPSILFISLLFCFFRFYEFDAFEHHKRKKKEEEERIFNEKQKERKRKKRRKRKNDDDMGLVGIDDERNTSFEEESKPLLLQREKSFVEQFQEELRREEENDFDNTSEEEEEYDDYEEELGSSSMNLCSLFCCIFLCPPCALYNMKVYRLKMFDGSKYSIFISSENSRSHYTIMLILSTFLSMFCWIPGFLFTLGSCFFLNSKFFNRKSLV